ncbi:hypothetical protein [Ramlibacter humi]|uniref:Uncharacterized protein n=1 Tax=Ramlibacter humi TaxID=2530451 RepID=A0A4Z0BDW1_9BURK|nr:hypothetical protein [Ramlibacter humi]TFY96653.1 hypothetical protein EZ216_19905 [Ramlibacter humi]
MALRSGLLMRQTGMRAPCIFQGLIMNTDSRLNRQFARKVRWGIGLFVLGWASVGAAADAAGKSPAGVSDVMGRWQVNGTHTELEYGPEVVSSSFGLPSGQRIGTIGNGGVGSFDYGVRNGYKPYEVERKGDLQIQRDGKFTWTSHASSKRGANCFKVTESRMSGMAFVAGGKLELNIADGQETTSYKGCQGEKVSTNLSGQKRGYEAKVDGKVLRIRQIQPSSSSSSLVAYQRT